jgi:hypothetical protein
MSNNLHVYLGNGFLPKYAIQSCEKSDHGKREHQSFQLRLLMKNGATYNKYFWDKEMRDLAYDIIMKN